MPSPNLVQSANIITNGSGSVQRTLNGVAQGNLLVVNFIAQDQNTVVSDNNNNVWNIIYGFGPAGNLNVGIAWVENCIGGNTTVTINDGAVFTQACFAEFSSGTPGAALHVDKIFAPGHGTIGTAATSGSATTTNNVELILGMGQANLQTMSPGSGFTLYNSNGVNDQFQEYQVTSSSGSYAATFTNAGSTSWGAMGLTFLVLPLPIFNTKVGRFNDAGILVGNLIAPIWTGTNSSPVTENSNVTTDQNLMSQITPANTLNTGRNLHLVAKGVFSTPAASTATLTFKVMLGGVTLLTFTTAANAGSITNNGWRIEADLMTTTAGASGTIESGGTLSIDLGATSGAAASVYVDNNTAVSSSIDLTQNQTLQITVSFSAGSSSNSCTQRLMSVNTVN